MVNEDCNLASPNTARLVASWRKHTKTAFEIYQGCNKAYFDRKNAGIAFQSIPESKGEWLSVSVVEKLLAEKEEKGDWMTDELLKHAKSMCDGCKLTEEQCIIWSANRRKTAEPTPAGVIAIRNFRCCPDCNHKEWVPLSVAQTEIDARDKSRLEWGTVAAKLRVELNEKAKKDVDLANQLKEAIRESESFGTPQAKWFKTKAILERVVLELGGENKMKLLFGDCLELLKEIPDESIDCVITDPPYGIGESNEKNLTRGNAAFGGVGLGKTRQGITKATDYGTYSWDKVRLSKEYFDEIRRVSKVQVIFGGNYYADYLPVSWGWRVWDKRVTDKMSNDLSDCELVWTSEKKGVRIFRHLWSGLLQKDMRHKEKRVHPTQKPLAVMEWLVKLHSQGGATVLDPFMGSGTTGVACKKLGREFIGMELDPKYFEIAKKRIEAWSGQERLGFGRSCGQKMIGVTW